MFQKIFTFLSLSLVLVGGFFVNFDVNNSGVLSIGGEAYAANAPATPSPATDEEMKKMINKGISYMNGAIEVMTVVVSPAIFLASWLMTPDWTSGDLFNLRPVLHNLWILVSNVTYFIYALLLIFIALATIFNSQNYGYKKLLPRLALGIILVPLTWWFVQFIISLATIVTASVINLPMEVVQNNAVTNGKTDAWWSDPTIHKKFQFYTDDLDKSKISAGGVEQEKSCNTSNCFTPKQVLTDASGVYSALLIYGHGVFKIGEAKNLKGSIDVAKTGMSILNQLIIGTIMFVIFGFLVIALVFLLFMRAIKLWFYAIFSPLMTLRYVVGDGLFGKDNADGFEIKEFIGLAFVPALVGLALSFGLMIITVLQNAGSKPGNPISCNSTDIASDKGCVIGSLAGNPQNTITSKLVNPDTKAACGNDPSCLSLTVLKFGGIEFEFYGGLVGKDAAATNVNDTRGTLNSLGGMFGILIIDMISIMFIWTAFMAAKNVSKVAQAVIKPFEDMGKKVGSLAKDLPKYTPIPGTGGLSLKGGEKLMNNAENALNKAHEEEFKKSKYGKMFGGDRVTSKADEANAKQMLSEVNNSSHKNLEKVGELIRKNGSTDLEYSDMFTDMIGHIHKQFNGDRLKMVEALKKVGYTEDNAEKIADRTRETGKVNTQDKDLITALKSMGTTGSKGDNNSSAGFIQTEIKRTDGKSEWKVKLGDTNIQIDSSGNITKESIDKLLKEGSGKWTTEGFEKQLSNGNISSDVRQKILEAIKGKEGDFYKKPDDSSTTAKSNISPDTTKREPEVR